MSIAVDVKSRFDRSEALMAHIDRHVDRALRPHGRHIRTVDVWLEDLNGPRGGRDKVARIGVSLRSSGTVVASATAEDLYQSVTMAADRARAAVDRRVTKLHRRHGSDPERRPPDDGTEAA
jgi:ribosome-associated translation inhibitor RaiA